MTRNSLILNLSMLQRFPCLAGSISTKKLRIINVFSVKFFFFSLFILCRKAFCVLDSLNFWVVHPTSTLLSPISLLLSFILSIYLTGPSLMKSSQCLLQLCLSAFRCEWNFALMLEHLLQSFRLEFFPKYFCFLLFMRIICTEHHCLTSILYFHSHKKVLCSPSLSIIPRVIFIVHDKLQPKEIRHYKIIYNLFIHINTLRQTERQKKSGFRKLINKINNFSITFILLKSLMLKQIRGIFNDLCS